MKTITRSPWMVNSYRAGGRFLYYCYYLRDVSKPNYMFNCVTEKAVTFQDKRAAMAHAEFLNAQEVPA